MTTLTEPRTTHSLMSAHSAPLWMRLLRSRGLGIFLVLIVVCLIAASSIRGFDQPITVTYLLLDVAPTLMIALPMTLLIITGEIDLSVASVIGLSSVLFGVFFQAGVPIALAAVLAVLAGAIGGALNGFLVTVMGLPSLAVTIGTLALFRGIAVGLLGTGAVTDWPESWTAAAQSKIADSNIPTVVLPIILLFIVFCIALHFTPFGRGVYAIGLNTTMAHFSGVHVIRTKMILFIVTSTVAALAGIYYTLRYGSARGDNATGFELQVIAAVLLGGVSIFGGKGGLPGVVGGVVLIGVVASGLRLAGFTADIITIVTGVLLVLSVVLGRVYDSLRTVANRRSRNGKSGKPRQKKGYNHDIRNGA